MLRAKIKEYKRLEQQIETHRGRFSDARRMRCRAWRDLRHRLAGEEALIWLFNAGLVWGLAASGNRIKRPKDDDARSGTEASTNGHDLLTLLLRALPIARLLQTLLLPPDAPPAATANDIGSSSPIGDISQG